MKSGINDMLENIDNNGKIIAKEDYDVKDVLNFVNDGKKEPHIIRLANGKIQEFKFEK